MTRKEVNFDAVCFPLVLLERKKNTFFVNTKNVLSHVLKISEISLVLRTRDSLILSHSMKYIWHSPKKVNILYLFHRMNTKAIFSRAAKTQK